MNDLILRCVCVCVCVCVSWIWYGFDCNRYLRNFDAKSIWFCYFVFPIAVYSIHHDECAKGKSMQSYCHAHAHTQGVRVEKTNRFESEMQSNAWCIYLRVWHEQCAHIRAHFQWSFVFFLLWWYQVCLHTYILHIHVYASSFCIHNGMVL